MPEQNQVDDAHPKQPTADENRVPITTKQALNTYDTPTTISPVTPQEETARAGPRPTKSRRKKDSESSTRVPAIKDIVLLAIGVAPGFLAGYFSAYYEDVRKSVSDLRDQNEFAASIKASVAVSCTKQAKQYEFMIKDSREGGMIAFNSYQLPRFPSTLKQQLIDNSKAMLIYDKNFGETLSVLSDANYELTFSTREANGSIFGQTLYTYIAAIDKICTWAAGRAPNEHYLDLKPID